MGDVQLSDLVADPDLGLRLLHGSAEQVVRGVYVTDLLDPRRYLHGGELVLSGLVWRTGPHDSEAFVSALAAKGVAALAAGAAQFGSIPTDLVDACRKHDVPLVEVPVALSFSTLSERVMAAHRSLGREWVAAVASGAGLEQVLALAADELGAECWVLSAAGRVVAGTAALPEPDELFRVFRAADRPGAVHHGEYLLHAVGEGTGPRLAQWFVAVRSAGAEAVGELATVVALVRNRVEEARQIAGRSVESALRNLLDGTSSPAEAVARLETAGLEPGEPLRVVMLSTATGGERGGGTPPDVAGTTPEPGAGARASGPASAKAPRSANAPASAETAARAEAAAVLRELAAATGLPAVTAPLHDGAVAVFAADETRLSALPGRFRDLLAAAGSLLHLSAGMSDLAGTEGLRSALEEAGHARRLAETGAESAVVTAGELASHRVLLAAVPQELRRSYRDRLLSPIVQYDRSHGAELLHTLRMFLECSGSWSRCAEHLHIHVNTLRYRIGRVEHITGRDLGEFAVRVDFHLALQLADRDPP